MNDERFASAHVVATRIASTGSSSSSNAAPKASVKRSIGDVASVRSSSLQPGNKTLQVGSANSANAVLRLSSRCSSSMAQSMVDLSRDHTWFGRTPQCDVVFDDTKRCPLMISRKHACIQRLTSTGGGYRWLMSDAQSTNGVCVNDERITQPTILCPGDVIVFGRQIEPPEFEYVFDSMSSCLASPPKVARISQVDTRDSDAVFRSQQAEKVDLAKVWQQQMQEIEQRRREVETEWASLEQQRKSAEENQQRMEKTSLKVEDLYNELACTICQDWIVNATSLKCAHAFCWRCINDWLLRGSEFVCPYCRTQVAEEPCRSLALDAVVQKAVAKASAQDREDYEKRCAEAVKEEVRRKKEKEALDQSVQDAIAAGKSFFHIDSAWRPKDKSVFERGIKGYTGECREAYCRLIGLTLQWIHSANKSALQRACQNLAVTVSATASEEEIRRRLLMFLRWA